MVPYIHEDPLDGVEHEASDERAMMEGNDDAKVQMLVLMMEQGDLAGPLAFVDTPRWQVWVGGVIFANAIIIGLETDFPSKNWWYVEQALLVFFVFELFTRALHHGWTFVEAGARFGNFFDFVIVAAGVVDLWLVPGYRILCAGADQGSSESEFNGDSRQQSMLMSVVSVLRLLRIVRLLRLVRIVPQLYKLGAGVVEALQGMLWVLVFLLILLYAVAIILTRLIGHSPDIMSTYTPGPEEAARAARMGMADVDDIHKMFSSVLSSMFVLFELMSCWSLMRFVPLFVHIPVLRLLAVLFYIFAAWALLAIMTGVVSERMVSVKEEVTQHDRAKAETAKEIANERLMEIFRQTDVDNNGSISKHEFDNMLARADVLRSLMDLSSTINVQDLTELFNWFDHNKDNHIEMAEFIEGFVWLNDSVNPKSFVKLQEKMAADILRMESNALAFIDSKFNALQGNLQLPLRKIHAVSEQIQRLDDLISSLEEDARQRMTRQDLQDLEQRLSGQLDSVLERVEELGRLQAKGRVRHKAGRRHTDRQVATQSRNDTTTTPHHTHHTHHNHAHKTGQDL